MGIYEQQDGIAFGFAHLDSAVRGDGPQVGIICIRHPPNLPILYAEVVVLREPFHHIRRQAADKSHGPTFGSAQHLLKRLPEYLPMQFGPLHISSPSPAQSEAPAASSLLHH